MTIYEANLDKNQIYITLFKITRDISLETFSRILSVVLGYILMLS